MFFRLLFFNCFFDKCFLRLCSWKFFGRIYATDHQDETLLAINLHSFDAPWHAKARHLRSLVAASSSHDPPGRSPQNTEGKPGVFRLIFHHFPVAFSCLPKNSVTFSEKNMPSFSTQKCPSTKNVSCILPHFSQAPPKKTKRKQCLSSSQLIMGI